MVASLTGELGAGLRLGQGLGQMASQRQQQRLGAQQQELLGGLRRQSLGLGGATPQQQQQASLELLSADPVGSKKFFDSFSSLTTRDQELTKERNSKIGLAGSNLLQFDDSQLNAATLQAARAFANSGDEDSANRALQLSQLPPEELRPRLEALTTQSRDIEQVIASGEKKAKSLVDQSQKELDNDIKKSKDDFDKIDKLRKGVLSISKEFTKVRDANNRIEAIFDTNKNPKISADFAALARSNPNAIKDLTDSTEAFGDMALIFNFMKMLDPGSTVREGEFATAANTGGADEKLINFYNNALKGTRLTEAQRAGLRSQATGLFGKAKTQNDKDLKRFRNSAEAFGLPQDQIFETVDDLSSVSEEELIKAAQGG
ncbi:MAG: hypothetical protein E2O80_06310 [Betaproteobacteria bacterium]|nr:MAG: hypothetical protein E2O86_03970 [Bacteroidota bacterium]TDI80626.1 MAG: hypothetical protein E2O80_06310 [Betaproteobacteria bacterium]